MSPREADEARRWEAEREARLEEELLNPHLNVSTFALIQTLLHRVEVMAKYTYQDMLHLCEATPRRDPYYAELPGHDAHLTLVAQRYMALTATLKMLNNIAVMFENEPRLSHKKDVTDKRLSRGIAKAEAAMRVERHLLDQYEPPHEGEIYANEDIAALDADLPTGIEGEDDE